MAYYEGVDDLSRFFLGFRETVFKICPTNSSVYLNIGGPDHKFRQLATLYLAEREVRSNWTDDGYIFPHLPESKRDLQPAAGSCVVERTSRLALLDTGTRVGPFSIGILDGAGKIVFTTVEGGHGRESDASNWWFWVEHRIKFNLRQIAVAPSATKVRVRFEFATRGKQVLTLRAMRRDGSVIAITLPSEGDQMMLVDRVIDVPANEISEIAFETDGTATQLGNSDTRMASWIIRNLKLTPVTP
jgi:hypothetical protein